MAKKKGMKKSMAKKAMKSMKKRAMKKTAASYKSKSRALRAVFTGKIMKSKGGLKKEALMKSKSGKIVSKKKSVANKKKSAKWLAACAKARKSLGVKGFAVI